MKKTVKSPLKIGKKSYGTLSKEEAFKKALEPYFTQKNKELVVS